MMNPSDPRIIPGRVSLVAGQGGLSKIEVKSATSRAEVYLHGAHVTHFQEDGAPPLLFMSGASEFAPSKPIRGGVPVIFPWFGLRDGQPAHGHARTTEWEWTETTLLPDDSVCLRFKLPRFEDFDVEYLVTVGRKLSLELVVHHLGKGIVGFETCLHTYFHVSDIDTLSITGLANSVFFDKLTNTRKTETTPELRIRSEVDRVYQDTAATVEILDPGYNRTIRIEKSGSDSTVVWNPWIDKSIRMTDFGDDEYRRMVCVESGNVGADKVMLSTGESARLRVQISSDQSARQGSV